MSDEGKDMSEVQERLKIANDNVDSVIDDIWEKSDINLKRMRVEMTEEFAKFMQDRKVKIRTISDNNSMCNKDGFHVIVKGDNWEEENEWDKLYQEMKDKEEK